MFLLLRWFFFFVVCKIVEDSFIALANVYPNKLTYDKHESPHSVPPPTNVSTPPPSHELMKDTLPKSSVIPGDKVAQLERIVDCACSIALKLSRRDTAEIFYTRIIVLRTPMGWGCFFILWIPPLFNMS